MNAVEKALSDYYQQEIGNTAVIRAIAESATLFAPMLFAADHLGLAVADQTVILSPEFQANPRVLYLFSSHEAVLRATGQPLGAFSGNVTGVAVLDALSPARFDSVYLNFGSNAPYTFTFDSDHFDFVKLVAQVVRLERALAAATEDSIPVQLLRDHPGYMIALNADSNTPAVASVNGVNGSCAFVFTAPDHHEYYGRQTGQEPRTITLPGASLFAQLQNFDVAGVVLNPLCPGSTVLLSHLFPRIAAGQ